jgi:hypothetical protein
MNTFKKISVLLAMSVVAHTGSATTDLSFMAGDIGHFTLGNDVTGSASAVNMGSTFSNSMTTNANTTVDQDIGDHTTSVYDGASSGTSGNRVQRT